MVRLIPCTSRSVPNWAPVARQSHEELPAKVVANADDHDYDDDDDDDDDHAHYHEHGSP